MKGLEMNKGEVQQPVKELKYREAAGPLCLKPDFYTVLDTSELCIEKLAECFDKELDKAEKNQREGRRQKHD